MGSLPYVPHPHDDAKGGARPPLESPQPVLRTVRGPLKILPARAEYPQGVRPIRKAAKQPTAARFIRPCAKVFAFGKNTCTPDSRRASPVVVLVGGGYSRGAANRELYCWQL